MRKHKLRAAVLIMVAATLWGLMVVPLKKGDYDPLWTTWVRLASSAFVLAILNWNYVRTMGLPRLPELLVGLLVAAAIVFWTTAVPWTSAANASVLSNIGPFIALLAEVGLYRYRVKAREVGLMLVMLIGLVLMVGGVTIPRLGDVLTLASGVTWGLAIPLGQRLPKGGFQRAVLWGQCLGVVVLPLGGLAARGVLAPPIPLAGQVCWLGFLAVVSSGAYLIHTRVTSSALIPSHLNSALLMVQAVVSTILGAAFLAEPLGFRDGLGAILIMGAALGVVLTRNGEKGAETK